MHRFVHFAKGPSGGKFELRGAHLVGADGVPVRGELRVETGEIRCESRNADPVGLSLLWPVPGCGEIQLETTRLPPREKPYHLHIELARHRLMRISQKREEWGLYDYPGMDDLAAQVEQARDLFVQALQFAENPAKAAELADRSLAVSSASAEAIARFHAGVFLTRRMQSGGMGRGALGVMIPGSAVKNPAVLERARRVADFVRVPFVWRSVQPKEQDARYEATDALVKAAGGAGLTVRGGPLLHFGVRSVPDWMYIWENDYEAIADFAREHVRRTVKRYAGQVATWIVASGLHAEGVFPLTFEQIIDLTRSVTSIAKQTAPRSQVVLELTQPWGEYYARNQRTIPPLLYAEMVVQSGISFDGFALQLLLGIGSDGYHFRDLFQVSSLVDRLANLGKPVHISAVAVPSAASNGDSSVAGGGAWRDGWSEKVQAEWYEALCEVAISKPYVESLCLDALVDGPDCSISSGGLLHEDLSPKAAYGKLSELHLRLRGEAKK